MIRIVVALTGLVLLAGCESAPPPHIPRLQSSCAVGDTYACGTLAQADTAANQRAIAAAALFSANNAAVMQANTQLFAPPPMMPPVTCMPTYGGGTRCR